jgi:hypothetical protein
MYGPVKARVLFYNSLEKPVGVKHYNLLQALVNYGRKMSYDIGPCSQKGNFLENWNFKRRRLFNGGN